MYHIGEKIVYPMHGAGIIDDIEEKKILGDIRKYYVLKIPFGEVKIMLPVDNCNTIGVRHIVSKESMEEVIETLAQQNNDISGNWNRRYRENMEKLKTGEIKAVAEVVRNLGRIEKTKKLSTGEKKMFVNAKQILLSEMILVKDISLEEAEIILQERI